MSGCIWNKNLSGPWCDQSYRAGWYGFQIFKLSLQLNLLVCYSEKNCGVIRFFLFRPLTLPPSQNFSVKIFIIWNFYKSLIKPIQLGIGVCLYYPMSCVTPKNMFLILKYYIVDPRPHLQIIYVMSKILVIRPYKIAFTTTAIALLILKLSSGNFQKCVIIYTTIISATLRALGVMVWPWWLFL